MAKHIDYPRTSLKSALQLAEAVSEMGGTCAIDMAAEKLGKRVSGAFAAQTGGAVKYGLVQAKAGKIFVTSLYKEFKLAYTEEDAMRQLRKAFLAPPLFDSIYERFKKQRLPIEHFEKLLIREFDVPDAYASRIAGYFTEGAKQCGLLGSDFLLSESDQGRESDPSEGELDDGAEVSDEVEVHVPFVEKYGDPPQNNVTKSFITVERNDEFVLNVSGPGVNFSLQIRELEDLELVQAMMRKVEKALRAKVDAT